jgi:hypothetical protein
MISLQACRAHLPCSPPVAHEDEELIQAATIQAVHNGGGPLVGCRPPLRPLHPPVRVDLRHRPVVCTKHDRGLLGAMVSQHSQECHDTQPCINCWSITQLQNLALSQSVRKHAWLQVQLMIHPLKNRLSQPLPEITQGWEVLGCEHLQSSHTAGPRPTHAWRALAAAEMRSRLK